MTQPMPPQCTRAPEGWRCTRGFHEDGPCALVSIAPNLDEFLAKWRGDPNLWWRLGSGDYENLFEEALDRIDELYEEIFQLTQHAYACKAETPAKITRNQLTCDLPNSHKGWHRDIFGNIWSDQDN